MYRTILTHLLLLSVLLQPFSREVIVMSFALNRDYIAKTFCENRNRPQLHCNGRCYLAKKLKAEQERADKETTERLQHLPLMQLFCQTDPVFAFSGPVKHVVQRLLPHYVLRHYVAPLPGAFRPPRA